MISFNHVSYRYPFQDTDAVSDLTFNVSPGSVVLVTGVSGCGKTTLMRLANGLCPHYYEGTLSGNVKIFGKDTQTSSVSELVGTLFQDPEDQFFALNVRDEMGFALKTAGIDAKTVEKRIDDVAQRLRISELLKNSISALSEGQKQRVALAEILVTLPRALILDEPSANLDPEATARFAQELNTLKNAGYAILVVDHRLHWLKDVADEVIVMKEGRICRRGFFEILNDETLRREYGLRNAEVIDVREILPETDRHNCVLEAKGLTFDYEHSNHEKGIARFKKLFSSTVAPSDRPVLLENINFTLPIGITALIGDNGSGKTTLARLITGLNRGEGELFVRGRLMPSNELLKHAGLVLQNADHQLQMRSVREEIRACLFAAGQDAENESQIESLLDTFSLLPLADRHPQSLSGGQKQRLVIACALAKDPDILILDEPTSGLDGENMKRVAGVLNKAAANGKAVLLITHDLELLALCAQRAIRMHSLKQSNTLSGESSL
ncbi:MAG: ABC transporter ATP-binding protein [Candidatus Aphodousia sp.]|nr:ABC transporter ATP-binding protein [Sutterella sp.]MDY2899383.1 ABC transporter ATP-binding protein [Candidatus Aphodousia sp.]